ncbi:MAG: hypothetical protein JW741_19640 [Sedimentisphaerales bacterium]|nr:hypothetical protein [Sedimentisphaerales bacterium]
MKYSKVADQFAVVSEDNDELVCRLANPQLSSIALAAERAGNTPFSCSTLRFSLTDRMNPGR